MSPLLLLQSRWLVPGLVALVILGLIADVLILHSRIANLKRTHVEHLKADAEAALASEVAARASEAAAAAVQAQIEQNYQQELERVEATSNRLRADLDAGTVRLRSRFTCPSVDVPKAGPGPGVSHEATGLRNPDAQFLVRLADACDAQVRAAQNIIRNDRGKP